MGASSVTLFRSRHFSEVEAGQLLVLEGQIETEQEDYLLNVNEQEYLDHLVSQYAIDPIEVDFDRAYATDEQRMIPAEAFPPMSNVTPGRRYPKQVFTFHLPFRGAVGLWGTTPNPTIGTTPNPTIHRNFPAELDRDGKILSFDVVQFTSDVEQVNTEYDSFVRYLREQLASLRVNVLNLTILFGAGPNSFSINEGPS